MKDLTPIVSHNLTELRKSRGLTQGQLAEKFAYTDKSISKWEHGEALPDLNTLQELADFYGVTLDYLTHEESDASLQEMGHNDPAVEKLNKSLIAGLSVTFIWTLAICAVVGCKLFNAPWPYWMALLWAIPASFLLLIFINRRWGKTDWRFPLSLTFIWTLVIVAYVESGMDLPDGQGWNLWIVLVVAVPITIALVLFQKLKKNR